MPNTRFRRCAQVIEARRSAGVGASGAPVELRPPPLSRLAFATRPQYRVLGANTPWKRVSIEGNLRRACVLEDQLVPFAPRIEM